MRQYECSAAAILLIGTLTAGTVSAETAETADGGVETADGGDDRAAADDTVSSAEVEAAGAPAEAAGAPKNGDAEMDEDDVGDDEGWGDEEGWGGDDGWGDDTGWDSDAQRSSGSASLKVQLHGVFENQLQGMWLRKDGGIENDSLVNDYTKLRVDLSADLAGDVSLKAEGAARIFAGETQIAFTHLIPKKTRAALVASDQRWAPFLEETYPYDNEYYINTAYLKVPIGPLVLFVGKQPLEQGVGYVWNPTDVFTRKELFDPTYEKPGVVALRIKAALGAKVNLDLVGVPKDDFKSWTGGGRASIMVGPLRLSAAGYITRITREDLVGSLDAMLAAALVGQDPESAVATYSGRRIMAGGEAVLDIEGVRLWTEGAYNFIEDKAGLPDDYLEVVGGAEYFFTTETHVMLEYLHYGAGPKQHSGFYRFNDWMSVLAGDLKMLGRDFLFESVDHPVADFWTLGLSSFQSLGDASAAIMADARWQFREDAELWFLLSFGVGEKNDFFSSSPGQGWIRLTAYF